MLDTIIDKALQVQEKLTRGDYKLESNLIREIAEVYQNKVSI